MINTLFFLRNRTCEKWYSSVENMNFSPQMQVARTALPHFLLNQLLNLFWGQFNPSCYWDSHFSAKLFQFWFLWSYLDEIESHLVVSPPLPRPDYLWNADGGTCMASSGFPRLHLLSHSHSGGILLCTSQSYHLSRSCHPPSGS